MPEDMRMQTLTEQAIGKRRPTTETQGNSTGVDRKSSRDDRKESRFDGFLNSLLGASQSEQGAANQVRERANTTSGGDGNRNESGGGQTRARRGPRSEGKDNAGEYDIAAAADALPSREREALKRVIKKAMSENQASSGGTSGQAGATQSAPASSDLPLDGELDDATILAAREAIALLWNILFPFNEFGPSLADWTGGGEQADALANIAALLSAVNTADSSGNTGTGALAMLGAASIAGSDAALAIEAANASAEMNGEAVLAAIEELLEALPDETLEKVRADLRTGSADGEGTGKSLAELAEALGLTLIGNEDAPADAGASLMARLAAESGRPVLPPAEPTTTAADGEPQSAGQDATLLEQIAGQEDMPAVPAEDSETTEEQAVTPATSDGTAKSSGGTESKSGINGEIAAFLEEKIKTIFLERPINNTEVSKQEIVDALSDMIEQWVSSSGEKLDPVEKERIKEQLATIVAALGAEADAEAPMDATEIFSTLKSEVEKLLLKTLAVVEANRQVVPKVELNTQAITEKTGPSDTETAFNQPAASEEPRTSSVNSQTSGAIIDGPAEEAANTNAGRSQALSRNDAVGSTGTGSVASQPQAPLQAQSSGQNSGSVLQQMENIERLAELMKLANRRGASELTLQLSPPELGKVTVRVQAKDGVVSALLRVEQPEAATHLTSGLQQLRDNLKAQGIELGGFEVRHQGEQAGNFANKKKNRDDKVGGVGRAAGIARNGSDDSDAAGAVPEHIDKDGHLNLMA